MLLPLFQLGSVHSVINGFAQSCHEHPLPLSGSSRWHELILRIFVLLDVVAVDSGKKKDGISQIL